MDATDEDAFMKNKLKEIMLQRKVTEVFDIMQVDADIALKLQTQIKNYERDVEMLIKMTSDKNSKIKELEEQNDELRD